MIRFYFGLFFTLLTSLAQGEEAILAKKELPPSLPLKTGEISESLRNEGRIAADRAVRWLLTKQNTAGHWSDPTYPALTALPLWAIINHRSEQTNQIDNAFTFMLSCAHDNGAIYKNPEDERKGGGLSTYNTALCIIPLHLSGRKEFLPYVLKGRSFLAKSQHLGEDVYRGGMGYDPSTGRPYTDLSNSYMAFEAMRLTQAAEDLRTDGTASADLDWKEAAEYIARVQNRPESNPQSWTSNNPEDKGGFAYHPEKSMAGTYTNTAGEIKFRSYGSMTYAGLLSFIYADVDKNDPRVMAAFDWAVNHWTLEENPGMGNQGLFYFYNVLSKGLHTFGNDVLHPKDKPAIQWRETFVTKLVNLQKIDSSNGTGYWVNEENRWWETDPVLVTSYALIALQMALQ